MEEDKLEKIKKEMERYFSNPGAWTSKLATYSTWTEKLLAPIEFERDEHGTLYGYKILKRITKIQWCVSPNYPFFRHSIWENNELTADQIPNYHSMHGIHGTKTLKDLQEWIPEYKHQISNPYFAGQLFIVRLALYGEVVIETERGFRAHQAKIMEVLREV